MGNNLATKCYTILDMLFNILLFSSNFGILIWNRLHADQTDKYLAKFGEAPFYIGIVSAFCSLEMDIFLFIFVSQQVDVLLHRWNFACLGLAFFSWVAYLSLSIYFREPYFAIGAFFFLYSRVTLVMIAKAEFIGMFVRDSTELKESSLQCPDSRINGSKFAAPATVVRSMVNEKSPSFRTKVHVDERDELDSVNMTGNKLTFCTFLGSKSNIAPDHYMASSGEPVIKANEEKENGIGESKTKL